MADTDHTKPNPRMCGNPEMTKLPFNDQRQSLYEDIPLNKLSRAGRTILDTVVMVDYGTVLQFDDRALAIVDAASLERSMEILIQEKMRPLGKTEFSRLFVDGGAPLVSLSSKIVVGYALELFGARTRDELNRIRKIRNQFAHAAGLISFDTKSVKSECEKLIVPSEDSRPHPAIYPEKEVWPPVDAKMRYHYACEGLSSAFILKNEEVSHLMDANEDRWPLD